MDLDPDEIGQKRNGESRNGGKGKDESLMSYNKGKNNPMYGKHHSGKTKQKMRQAQSGSNHHNWKGGIYQSSNGYVFVLKPEHPNSMKNGYVKRARLVAEETLGRYLYPDEIPHHKNEIKDDDSPENIDIMTEFRHRSFHRKKRAGNQRRNALGQFARE